MKKERIEKIKRMMNSTWNYIGSDALTELTSGESLSRSEVIELVLDASRMETLIAKNDDDHSVIAEYRALPYNKQMKIAREAFPFGFYGM